MKSLKQTYLQEGYLHIPNFFDFDLINSLLFDSKSIFLNIFLSKKYTGIRDVKELNENEFNKLLYKLFSDDVSLVSNCGKQIQHLISLHKLSLNDKIIELLKEMGIQKPNISTRPVLFFNHPKLAKEKFYYKVDAHQDWRSMQGSLNSIVIWVPLTDINKDLGALEIIPRSHMRGLITDHFQSGFGMVNPNSYNFNEFKTIEVKLGDILIFSSFLIHQSGENITDRPRWSCHFRYNDLYDHTFIERGYPHSYIYKPIEELITPNFPDKNDIINTFKHD
jgi:phytanoyl-CoA hydroxylase